MSTTSKKIADKVAVAWFLFRGHDGMWKWAKADASGEAGESREAFSTAELCLLELKRGIRAHEAGGNPNMAQLPLSPPAVVAMLEILKSTTDFIDS